jgi:hypothetical protein
MQRVIELLGNVAQSAGGDAEAPPLNTLGQGGRF